MEGAPRTYRLSRVQAAEVLDAHLAVIARVNPRLNAIVTLTADLARAQADHADRAAARDFFHIY